MIDWNRVKRTIIQSASGAGVALITALSADWSRETIITSLVGFVTTIVIAVLMNISKQTEE